MMGAIFNPWEKTKRSEGGSLLTLIYIQGECRPEWLIRTFFSERVSSFFSVAVTNILIKSNLERKCLF